MIIHKPLQYALLLIFACAVINAEGAGVPAPAAKDKCPVCGMFVSKYPAWLGAVSFKNAPPAYFDGPKDLFTYLLNLKKYAPARTQTMITAIQVKDYYSLKPIDGRAAFYVIGSDVYGPMGKELVSFEKQPDAQAFLRDHKGKSVLRFNEITPVLLKSLE